MHQGDKTKPYIPAVDEPTIFAEKNGNIPIEWPSWRRYIEKCGRGGIILYPIQAPDYELIAIAIDLRKRLREELKNLDVELPAEPPPMYTQGHRHIALAWVLDTARREKLPPEEAVTMALALRKM